MNNLKFNISIIALIILFPSSDSFAQVFVNENFDSGLPVSWSVSDLGNSTGDSWVATAAGSNNLDGSDYMKVSYNNDGINNSQAEYLETPAFNASTATIITLEFDQYFFYDGQDSAKVQVFDGASWQTVYIVNVNWFGGGVGAWGNPNHPVIDLSAYKNSSMQVRFEYTDGEAGFSFFWAIDNVKISAPAVQKDLGIAFVSSPISNCGLGNEPVGCFIKNYGFIADSNFKVGFSVDGAPIATETVPVSLDAGDSVFYTFSTLADVSLSGLHQLQIYTMVSSDDNVSNDTITYYVNHQVSGSLQNSSTENFPLNWEAGAGVNNPEIKSHISFCGLPYIDSCLKIKSVTIDSIIHDRPDDLAIYLISPNNQDTIQLRWASIGHSTTPDTLTNIIFTDTSNVFPKNMGYPFNTGVYHPDESSFQNVFTGTNPNGEWTLWIRDIWSFGAPGTFFNWSMEFEICDSTLLNPPATIANFGVSALEICPGDSIQFIDSSDNAPHDWNWSFPGGSPVSSSLQHPKVYYSNGGNYTATLTTTNIGGVDSITKNINITVNTLPVAHFTYSMNGSTIDFTSSSTGPDSLIWDFGDVSIPGSGESDLTVTYPDNGIYVVCLSAMNSCSSDNYCDTITILTDGLHDFDSEPTQAYPNPFNNHVLLKFGDQHPKELIIKNVLGEELFREKVNRSEYVINELSDYPKGTYLLMIQTNNRTEVLQLIKR